MEEIMNLEAELLEKLMDSGEEVTIITINGYQVRAVVLDFECNVIKARVKDGRIWMIYRHAVSTIKM